MCIIFTYKLIFEPICYNLMTDQNSSSLGWDVDKWILTEILGVSPSTLEIKSMVVNSNPDLEKHRRDSDLESKQTSGTGNLIFNKSETTTNYPTKLPSCPDLDNFKAFADGIAPIQPQLMALESVVTVEKDVNHTEVNPQLCLDPCEVSKLGTLEEDLFLSDTDSENLACDPPSELELAPTAQMSSALKPKNFISLVPYSDSESSSENEELNKEIESGKIDKHTTTVSLDKPQNFKNPEKENSKVETCEVAGEAKSVTKYKAEVDAFSVMLSKMSKKSEKDPHKKKKSKTLSKNGFKISENYGKLVDKNIQPRGKTNTQLNLGQQEKTPELKSKMAPEMKRLGFACFKSNPEVREPRVGFPKILPRSLMLDKVKKTVDEKKQTKEKNYKCSHCLKSFGRSSHLKDHELTHSGIKLYICSYCKKRFGKNSHLIEHERIHTGEKPYKCRKCDLSFSMGGNMRRHEKRVHNGQGPYKCSFCDKIFRQSNHKKVHEQFHTEINTVNMSQTERSKVSLSIPPPNATIDESSTIAQQITRPQAQKIHRDSANLLALPGIETEIETHRQLEKTPSPKLKSKTEALSWKEYQKSKTSEKRSPSLVGDSKLKSKKSDVDGKMKIGNTIESEKRKDKKEPILIHDAMKSVKERQQIKRPKMDERRFKCQNCDMHFAKTSSRNRHELIHLRDKSYKCSICELEFFNIFALNSHEDTHKKLGTFFKCSMCTGMFLKEKDLNDHKKVHDLDNRTKCSHCEKRFSDKGNLERHERIHVRVKQYKCYVCMKKYTNKEDLRRHGIKCR